MQIPDIPVKQELAERLKELRREIQKGIDSSERGDTLVFSSSKELMAHIETEGRRILADRKSPEYRPSDTSL